MTPAAKGYEISLYNAYPLSFWALIIGSVTCGIIFLVYQIFFNKIGKLWIFGLIILFLINLTILLLPTFRGYVTLGRGDVLTHIGYAKEILSSTHFTTSNIYPAIHILLTNLSLLTGLTPELFAQLIPIFFTMFYMIFIFLLARIISQNRGQILLIATFGCLLMFGHENEMLAPSVECFYLLPFMLFLLFKMQSSTNRVSYFLAICASLIIIPIFHPGEGTIFLVLTFLCFGLVAWLYRRIKHPVQIDPLSSVKYKPVFFVSLTLLIVWFIWFSYTSTFIGTVLSIWDWLIYAIGKTTAMEYAAILEKASLSTFDFIILFFKMFGQVVIYCAITLAMFFVMLKKFIFNKYQIDIQQLNFSILFAIFGILMFVAFFSNIIWVGYGREMRYVIFAATILNGLGLYSLFHKKHRRLGTVLITIVLITTATFGIFNTYPSPLTRDNNSQVTAMETIGVTWFLSHQNSNLLIDNLNVDQLRFSNLILGIQNIPSNIRYNSLPPDHFGYTNNSMYGEFYNFDRYFIDSKLSRIINPSVFPEYASLWRFSSEDFYRLDYTDPSVNKIYSNGEFWVYYIHGSNALS
jgi:hypothetical protein